MCDQLRELAARCDLLGDANNQEILSSTHESLKALHMYIEELQPVQLLRMVQDMRKLDNPLDDLSLDVHRREWRAITMVQCIVHAGLLKNNESLRMTMKLSIEAVLPG